MARYDLSDFLEDGATVLEGIRGANHPDGKDYTFASPSAKVGLYLAHLFNVSVKAHAGVDLDEGEAGGLVLDDNEEKDLYRQVMGDTLAEMEADGVPWTSVQAIFRLLFAQHATGQDIAATIASSGEAPARPNRATRRTRAKAGRKSGNSGATASPTPPPASSGSSPSSTQQEPAAEAV